MHTIMDSNASQAYIDKALVPLVKELRNSSVPGSNGIAFADVLLGYEVFNEPEGMAMDVRLYHNYM
jgi:hypothetical protein